ncbi:unnamed protein product [Rotaria magnacalcarata]|uniref:Uncharacterized protein n=1 Tax=Rotaria magnacalcarata TaxID=392030 RepID=A0A820GFN8_9BILA|nr:unnamed protein product [Rotaria magnacalcarata]CAF4276182.1 unnamed protein product [Rotaria magnacalcarata]CAF4554053.1 unnamed protein product [Rotaria magnacalcarata]
MNPPEAVQTTASNWVSVMPRVWSRRAKFITAVSTVAGMVLFTVTLLVPIILTQSKYTTAKAIPIPQQPTPYPPQLTPYRLQQPQPRPQQQTPYPPQQPQARQPQLIPNQIQQQQVCRPPPVPIPPPRQQQQDPLLPAVVL